MEFLRQDFIDQLRAEIDETTGNVVIEAARFTPQQILEFNDETFELAFKGWCETRKDQLLEKAEAILRLHDNKDRFDKLRQSYKRGSVTPFIGAGLSVSSGYPGWTAYLYRLREETSVTEAQLTDFIQKGAYEEAAQLLFDALPPNAFDEHLENKFDDDERALSGCVRFLPHCFTSGVITTNFDSVLKRCYEDADQSFSEELLGAEATELPRLLGKNKNVLVKLHGKANTARNRILTKKEYDTHYTAGKTLDNSISAIANKTLLFMGCSLSADRTIQCLKKIRTDKGAEAATRHYAFLAIGDDNTERLRRRDELAEANIFPIWYPADEDHDECLMALLQKLTEGDVS